MYNNTLMISLKLTRFCFLVSPTRKKHSHQDRLISANQHPNSSTTRASYSHSPQTLERVSLNGSPSPLKTEAPRQTGPESRVPGRETPIPPASRRWVPPSLRPQHDLTPETQNDAVFRKVRSTYQLVWKYKLHKLDWLN